MSSMNVNRWALIVVSGVLLTRPPAMAITEVLMDADISRAFAIARSAEDVRSRFHAPYIMALSGPSLEQIEIITEFRRFVLAAEEQVRLGSWMAARGGYDQQGRTVKESLKASTGQVVIRARVRFHPLNAYIGVPPIDILLGEPSLLALGVSRTPNFSIGPPDNRSRPAIMGAVIEASFNAPSVNDRVLAVRVVSEGQELGRFSVDFSRLE